MSLTYSQIPQHQYLIDGIPSRTSGEWPGIKPNHWKTSLRIIQPIQTYNIFTNTPSIPLTRGRRHFSEQNSQESQFLPPKRLFTSQKYLENIMDKPHGLKQVHLNHTIAQTHFEKKHFPPRFGINNDPGKMHIRTFRPDGNYRTHNEILIEREFGTKKKLNYIEERRNGMNMNVPGDKWYKASDHLSGFFKEGGLIVGSTNRINHNKTTMKKKDPYYETLDVNMNILDKEKLWRNKKRNEIFMYDDNYVKTLGDWEKKVLGEYEVPKENDSKVKDMKGKDAKTVTGKKKKK